MVYWLGETEPVTIVFNTVMAGRKKPLRKYKKYFSIRTLNVRIRNLPEMKKWRSKVFQRDNWTCQKCEERGGELNAHHIFSFAKLLKKYKIRSIKQAKMCKDLWNIENGVTLCIKCHKLTKNYGKKNLLRR